MLLVSKEHAYSSFKSSLPLVMNDYKRLERLARIGAVVGQVWNQKTFYGSCIDLVEQSKWMQKFKALGIDFDLSTLRPSSLTTGGDASQKKLIAHLLSKTNTELSICLEYARYYRIEDDFVYFELVKQLCLRFNLQDNLARFYSTTGSVVNQDKLIDVLTNISNQMSPYDYEGLKIVNDHIVGISVDPINFKKNSLILGILIDYERQLMCSEREIKAGLSRKRLDEDYFRVAWDLVKANIVGETNSLSSISLNLINDFHFISS